MTPFKYHVFENIMENGAFALLEQMIHFHIIFKSIQNFTWIFLDFFSMLSKNKKNDVMI